MHALHGSCEHVLVELVAGDDDVHSGCHTGDRTSAYDPLNSRARVTALDQKGSDTPVPARDDVEEVLRMRRHHPTDAVRLDFAGRRGTENDHREDKIFSAEGPKKEARPDLSGGHAESHLPRDTSTTEEMRGGLLLFLTFADRSRIERGVALGGKMGSRGGKTPW